MTLQEKLMKELYSRDDKFPSFPNFIIYVDEAGSMFWQTKSGEYLWLQDDRKGMEAYIDETHQPVELHNRVPEGVRPTGVIWNNTDLENPFHFLDFSERIKTITI